jgi:hypothetical protein
VTSEQEPPAQRVVFDSTITELVDDSLRALTTSKEGRRLKRYAVVSASLSCWLVMSAVVIAIMQVPGTYAAVIGLVVGVVVALVYGSVYEDTIRKRTERLVRERVSGEPATWVMEARPEGLWTESGGVTTTRSWRLLQGVAETPRGIELQFRDQVVVVRARAFATVETRSAFIQRIRELCAIRRS